MYIYIYRHTHIYIYTHNSHAYVYIYIYTHIHTSISIDTYNSPVAHIFSALADEEKLAESCFEAVSARLPSLGFRATKCWLSSVQDRGSEMVGMVIWPIIWIWPMQSFFFREMVLPGYCIIECLLYTSGYFLLRFAISLEWWCLGNSPILRALWSSWWTMIHFARLFLSASCIYLKNS